MSSSPSEKFCPNFTWKQVEDATGLIISPEYLKTKVYSAQMMLGGSEMTKVAVHVRPRVSGFIRKREIMAMIQHLNIVSVLGHSYGGNRQRAQILIYEYVANGSLADYLWKEQKPTSTSTTTISLTWQQRLKICLGVARGLEHFHGQTKEINANGFYYVPYQSEVVHGEITPDNILLDENWVPKILYPGMVAPNIKRYHRSPECVKSDVRTRKMDVYAFGIILVQVWSGRMLSGEWQDTNLGEWMSQNVDSNIQGEIPDYCLNAFTEIIQKCLNADRNKRPDMNEVTLALRRIYQPCITAGVSRMFQRVSLKEIEDATENFNERYALGQGGEAKVYLAQIMLGGSEITQVAVKHLKPNSSGFEDEIQIMPKIHHPNIVSLLGYCDDSGQKILMYEYMANGSLASYLHKKLKPTAPITTTSSSSSFLSWQQRLKICLDAAFGLVHLHVETVEFSKGIIHRDIKPENILLDANWVAKISDFGMFKLSCADQIDSVMPTMLKGTGGYYAPEYLNYGHVTRKIDVYAFGVVLFQVLCRKMPWDRDGESYYRKDDEDLGEWAQQNVDSEIQGEISDYCLNEFTEIIHKSLSVDPEKRPTMDEVALTLQNALEHEQMQGP